MADITKITEDDDPQRCQGIIPSHGQCVNKAAEGSSFCLAHGGNRAPQSAEKVSLRNYRLGRFQASLQRHADSPAIKSLRDEIGILRILMEEKINRCTDVADLLLISGPLSDLVMKIDKVVTSCHKLENSMGQLIDQQAILQFANSVIGIVGSHIHDPDVLGTIGDEILTAIGEITKDESI